MAWQLRAPRGARALPGRRGRIAAAARPATWRRTHLEARRAAPCQPVACQPSLPSHCACTCLTGWRVKATAKDVELACRVMGRLAEPLGAATETAVLTAFDAYITRQLAAYPSSREQDEQQLRQGGLPW